MKQSLPPLPDPGQDHQNQARGACSICGQAIASATALYCVACYRKCLKPCPTCTQRGPRGKAIVIHKYQRHQGLPGTDVCTRCEEHHDEERQLVCKECNNERTIFVLPEKKNV